MVYKKFINKIKHISYRDNNIPISRILKIKRKIDDGKL